MFENNRKGFVSEVSASATVESQGGLYMLPRIEEKTSDGYKISDPYSKLFENRIVFLVDPVNAVSSSHVVSQLLYLDSIDDGEITLYINSPGGAIVDASTIIDTIGHINADVKTVCIGQASSVAALILAAGTTGKRYALPNSHIMLHQPQAALGGRGQASDITIQSARIKKLRSWMENFLAQRTGRTVEEVSESIERELFLNPTEALELGLIDEILD